MVPRMWRCADRGLQLRDRLRAGEGAARAQREDGLGANSIAHGGRTLRSVRGHPHHQGRVLLVEDEPDQAAILEALQRSVPHPNAVRLALARRREQRGEPPAVGVELPAHLQARDTTVQPHALETYDQLKEKHDASSDAPPAED